MQHHAPAVYLELHLLCSSLVTRSATMRGAGTRAQFVKVSGTDCGDHRVHASESDKLLAVSVARLDDSYSFSYAPPTTKGRVRKRLRPEMAFEVTA